MSESSGGGFGFQVQIARMGGKDHVEGAWEYPRSRFDRRFSDFAWEGGKLRFKLRDGSRPVRARGEKTKLRREHKRSGGRIPFKVWLKERSAA